MKNIFTILIFTSLFAGELEVDGDLKVTGSVVFQDETLINTAPKPLLAGIMFPFAGQSAPEGYLICAGQEVSRLEYASLFEVIGELYGNGDGVTTFNIPDLRGRLPLGKDSMNGTSANRVENEDADILGGNAGSEKHLLTQDELPSNNGYISHSMRGQGDSGGSFSYVHSLNTGPVGSDMPHNNMPPYLTVNYIIKY